MGNRYKKYLKGFIILITLVSVTSCDYFEGKHERVPVLLEGEKVDFATDTIIKKDIENTIEVEGKVFSSKIQKLSFVKKGILRSCNVYVGKEVKKGEVLATTDIGDIGEKIEITKLRIEQAEIKIDIAEESGDLKRIKDAKIAKEIKELELYNLEKKLKETALVSKLDGIVTSNFLRNIGGEVLPNATMVVIMQSSDLGVRFKVNKSQADQIEVGDDVKLIIDGKIYESEVKEKNNEEFLASIPKDIENRLKVSRKVKVIKVLDKIEGALLAPKIGVATDDMGRSRIQILNDGKIETRNIELGVEGEEYYQILDGVKEGEIIIVK